MGKKKDKRRRRRRRDEDGSWKAKSSQELNCGHFLVLWLVMQRGKHKGENGARPSKMLASRPARGRWAWKGFLCNSVLVVCPSSLSSLVLSSLGPISIHLFVGDQSGTATPDIYLLRSIPHLILKKEWSPITPSAQIQTEETELLVAFSISTIQKGCCTRQSLLMMPRVTLRWRRQLRIDEWLSN